jgi:hypothetical protein
MLRPQGPRSFREKFSGGDKMASHGPGKVQGDHPEIICAYASSALAAVFIRYVAGVAHPIYGHVVLALFALGGFLAAYLLIAGSRIEPAAKAANIIGAAVVSGICFAVVSYFL